MHSSRNIYQRLEALEQIVHVKKGRTTIYLGQQFGYISIPADPKVFAEEWKNAIIQIDKERRLQNTGG